MVLHFYRGFPVYWPLKALYNTCHIHPFTHTFIHWYRSPPCKAPTAQPTIAQGTIWGSVFCTGHFDMQPGFKPTTFRLLDDRLYLLSYSHPIILFSVVCTHWLSFTCGVLFWFFLKTMFIQLCRFVGPGVLDGTLWHVSHWPDWVCLGLIGPWDATTLLNTASSIVL